MSEIFNAIYNVVRDIPRGRVATYGQVAKIVGNRRLARVVGTALHHNPDPDTIPCHRVVNREGRLADKYVFGGSDVQRQLLISEGVEVKENFVDLDKYQWRK